MKNSFINTKKHDAIAIKQRAYLEWWKKCQAISLWPHKQSVELLVQARPQHADKISDHTVLKTTSNGCNNLLHDPNFTFLIQHCVSQVLQMVSNRLSVEYQRLEKWYMYSKYKLCYGLSWTLKQLYGLFSDAKIFRWHLAHFESQLLLKIIWF